MGTEEAMKRSGKTTKAPSSLPPAPAPALFHVRTRPRTTTTSKVMGVDCSPSPRRPSTPPLRSRVTVPFLWEDAPGKPKLPQQTAHRDRAPLFFFPPAAAASPALVRDHEGGGAAVPLKLPPRLQTAAAAEYSVVSSPRTVLHGPYYLGGKTKPPRPRPRPRPLRRSESAASRLLSWRKAAASKKGGGHDHDAPDAASCSSPPGSSASSSSSSSMSYFFDDHSRRSHWRQQADARDESEDGEEDGGAQGSVRITRFRRNSSLPNITTSRLWASVRKGVNQINPWS